MGRGTANTAKAFLLTAGTHHRNTANAQTATCSWAVQESWTRKMPQLHIPHPNVVLYLELKWYIIDPEIRNWPSYPCNCASAWTVAYILCRGMGGWLRAVIYCDMKTVGCRDISLLPKGFLCSGRHAPAGLYPLKGIILFKFT